MAELKLRQPQRHKAEDLLNQPDIPLERKTNPQEAAFLSDSLVFSSSPKASLNELKDKAFVDSNNNEQTYVEFYLSSLLEKQGRLSKIVVYFEPVSVEVPKEITLKWLQERNILAEIPVLYVDNDFTFSRQITIQRKPDYYNFFIIYLDGNNKAATIDGRVIINRIERFELFGAGLINRLVECKDLVITGIDAEDFNGYGYSEARKSLVKEVTLSWRQVHDYDKPSRWINTFENEFFNDTFGNSFKLTYDQMKCFDGYVIYKYNPYKDRRPEVTRPKNIELRNGLMPGMNDINGVWTFVKKTYDNSVTLTLNDYELTGFWAGFILR